MTAREIIVNALASLNLDANRYDIDKAAEDIEQFPFMFDYDPFTLFVLVIARCEKPECLPNHYELGDRITFQEACDLGGILIEREIVWRENVLPTLHGLKREFCKSDLDTLGDAFDHLKCFG